jgi:N-[(2S)-2-amino-2-carboxyethyl]-L-glutamate dehydrogenase
MTTGAGGHGNNRQPKKKSFPINKAPNAVQMLYIKEEHLLELGIDWHKAISTIADAVSCLGDGEYEQPIKPYLRYGDRKNRIIAMPAYIGGAFYMAGIKWIASFPSNVDKGLPRAHSVVILNEADTGVPVAIFNTALLSMIRTAAVSGLVLTKFLKTTNKETFQLGISGWGPIGQYHYQMVEEILGTRLEKCLIYDIRDTRLPDPAPNDKIKKASSWQEAYRNADIFITCTVSAEPYIDLPPLPGSLHLNVSLRDYKPEMLPYFKRNIIVDDWDEICRENTDVERMHICHGLQKADTLSLPEVHRNWTKVEITSPVFFNPMGMAVFDIALATCYYRQAKERHVGTAI